MPTTLLTKRLAMGRASAIVGNAPPDPYGACPHERSTGIAVVPIPAMPHRSDVPSRS